MSKTGTAPHVSLVGRKKINRYKAADCKTVLQRLAETEGGTHSKYAHDVTDRLTSLSKVG